MGTLTAGAGGVSTGYISAALAAYLSDPTTPQIGSISGNPSEFGVIEGLASFVGSPAQINISSPVGMPTFVTIDYISYDLTFGGSDGGFDYYDLDPSFPGFTNGVSYQWSFAPGSTYAVNLDGGSFALSGGQANFLRTRVFATDGGAFALTGGSASFNKGYVASLSGGPFSLNGGDASLTAQRSISLTGGSIAITGGVASFTKGRVLSIDSGNFALTGGALQVNLWRATLGGGSFALSGGAVRFEMTWHVTQTAPVGSWITTANSIPSPWALGG